MNTESKLIIGILYLLMFVLIVSIFGYMYDSYIKVPIATNKPDFNIEHFNNHSFITNYHLNCFIHDPDCECGGSD